jgi:hypothetical protein
MVATINMLTRNQTIAYVQQRAASFGLDPAAVLAVANQEGLNRAPDSGQPLKWWLPKEFNWSFGPPSWYGNGAGHDILARFNGNADAAAAWSWTTDGIDYWLQQVAQSARGLTGMAAINAIVTGFERPAAQNVPGEVARAGQQYASFQTPVGGATGASGVQVQIPENSGQTAPAPAQSGNEASGQVSPTAGAGLLPLGQIGPLQVGVPSGLLLGLLAVVLLVVGAIAMNPQKTAQVATTAVAV